MEYLAYAVLNPMEYLFIDTDTRKSAQKIARTLIVRQLPDRPIKIRIERAD